ncbi:MAG: 4-alpha-glucanotransferase [Deltaproteobacteria bacterium]|nr:4-alpha-glucanotransferase [Deltaproteobacteria bacterium]
MSERSCGVLLHISSLPSAFGIGDLGPAAHAFALALASAGVRFWQFLPLTPTSEFIGNSPYSSPSAFAGNPLFISPELLCEQGLVSRADVDDAVNLYCRGSAPGRVDYRAVCAQRRAVLNAAFARGFASLGEGEDFLHFCRAEASWLDPYALFAAIKEEHGGASWVDWPDALKWREPVFLESWEAKNRRSVLRHKFIQYLFFSQWRVLRRRCAELGLALIGDLPIYVTHDSADVWANPELFQLDGQGAPSSVAGVPPDYFSATGQRWGNPVYDWEAMRQKGFSWWIKRLEHNLRMMDVARLDHFRGFCAYWAIPAEEKTAVNGQWVKAPGRELFSALRGHFGPDLPLVAEDLGVITEDVRELMRDFALPGMKVLQFGFGGEKPALNPDAPFRHSQNSVVYTGTHDNPTTLDWFSSAAPQEQGNLARYAGRDLGPEDAVDFMLRLALGSPADLAVIPMQDILGLGEEGRMNTPSVAAGNWEWRLPDLPGLEELARPGPALAADGRPAWPQPLPAFKHLRFLCSVYGRDAREGEEHGAR